MNRYKAWAGGLHWGQLVMVLLGCAVVSAGVAFKGVLDVTDVTSAREEMRTYQTKRDSSFFDRARLKAAGFTDAEIDADTPRGARPTVKRAPSESDDLRSRMKAAGFSDAEIDADIGPARPTVKPAPSESTGTIQFDRAGAKASGYSDGEIDAYLGRPAPKKARTIEEAYAEIVDEELTAIKVRARTSRLLVSYAEIAASITLALFAVAALWWWLGARRRPVP